MLTTTDEDFSKHISNYMNRVNEDVDVLRVIDTAGGGNNVVVMGESTYNSIIETLHVLSQPKLAAQVREGMEEVRRHRNVEPHGIINPE